MPRLVVDVMLVLDVADDHLDDVLDRHEAVGAAIFVDDERQMGARRLHADQEIERRHRARHEQHRLEQIGLASSGVSKSIAPAIGRTLRRPFASCLSAQRRDEIRRSRGCGPCRADRRACRRRPAGANGRRCEIAPAPRAASRPCETATMSARGIIASSTRMSCRPSTFFKQRALMRRHVAGRLPRARPRCPRAPRAAPRPKQTAQAVDEAWARSLAGAS